MYSLWTVVICLVAYVVCSLLHRLNYDAATDTYTPNAGVSVRVAGADRRDVRKAEYLDDFGLVSYFHDMVEYFVDRGYVRDVSIRAAHPMTGGLLQVISRTRALAWHFYTYTCQVRYKVHLCCCICHFISQCVHFVVYINCPYRDSHEQPSNHTTDVAWDWFTDYIGPAVVTPLIASVCLVCACRIILQQVVSTGGSWQCVYMLS